MEQSKKEIQERFEKEAKEIRTELTEEIDGLIQEANKRKEVIQKRTVNFSKVKKVKRPFLKDFRLVNKWKKKLRRIPIPAQEELAEPVLFLMKENGYTDVIEGVKAGEFIIATPKGEKGIILTPDKLTSIMYGEQCIKAWFAYENCMSPYPENPVHNAEMYRKTTQKLAMNWRDRDETALITARTKMWLYIIGGVAIALILFVSTDVGKQFMSNLPSMFSRGGGEAVNQVAQQVAQSNASAVPNVGVAI